MQEIICLDDDDDEISQSSQSQPTLTPQQRERMEMNRQIGLARRLARQHQKCVSPESPCFVSSHNMRGKGSPEIIDLEEDSTFDRSRGSDRLNMELRDNGQFPKLKKRQNAGQSVPDVEDWSSVKKRVFPVPCEVEVIELGTPPGRSSLCSVQEEAFSPETLGVSKPRQPDGSGWTSVKKSISIAQQEIQTTSVGRPTSAQKCEDGYVVSGNNDTSLINEDKDCVEKSGNSKEASEEGPLPSKSRSDVEQKPTTEIKLSTQQLQVLRAIGAKKSVFVTGSAGTGKSFLLEYAIGVLKYMYGSHAVYVTASTGLAACALGGTTLHSFAGIGLGAGNKDALVDKVASRRESKNRWTTARALVIDEVSMVDGELFDKLDYVGRKIRSCTKPFGGIQLVVTGDFFQLPPVHPEKEAKYFAFNSDCWEDCFDLQVELTQVFRQSDEDFVSMLNEIRKGKCSVSIVERLSKCKVLTGDKSIIPTRLYPHKKDVGAENQQKLRDLGKEVATYVAKDEARNDFGLRMLSSTRAEKVISISVGAQVMLIKNLDTSSGLVNGARGVVVRFLSVDESRSAEFQSALAPSSHGWPVVRFACDGKERVVGPESWSVLEGNVEIAKRTQVPLILAWALSVHKCQGMTLDRVETDLSKAFEYGMVYVALSRVRNLEGLMLLGFDPSRIKVHPKVVAFYQELQKKASP